MKPKWNWTDAVISIVALAYALLTLIWFYTPVGV